MMPKNINNMEQVIVVNKIKAALFSVLDSIETYPYCVFSDVPVKKTGIYKGKVFKKIPGFVAKSQLRLEIKKKEFAVP